MTYLCTLIEFIQKLSLEDEEISNMLKETDAMNRDNTKLENQLEELEREHVRLQIEKYNLETISSFLDVTAIESMNNISRETYKRCVELKSLMDIVDFTKILRCHHIEMEAKCRKEWQPIEDCVLKTLSWHDKMEQRHIVQKYRRAEVLQREAEDALKTQLEIMRKSLKQSIEVVNQTKDKRNNLVIVLIKGSKNLDDLNSKVMKLDQYKVYIEDLRQEKLRIQNKIGQMQIKAFNPTLNSFNIQSSALAIKPKTETSNFIMPKFPSLSEILDSFNEDHKITSVTAIENSTSFCVKSILHNSKKSITTKQTKNVHFKVQLEEYQEEITEIETETENDKERKLNVEINKLKDSGENLQEMKEVENVCDIETINLLTPTNVPLMEETKDYLKLDNDSKHNAKSSKIEIQDCVVFKTPFPINELKYVQETDEQDTDEQETDEPATYETATDEQDKENIPNNVVNLNCSKQSTEICSSSNSSSHQGIKKILNTTKKSFYNDFLNCSSSSEASTKIAENFEQFLNQNNGTLFAGKEANKEMEINQTTSNFSKTNSSETQEQFLDFGTNKGFTFDSDDNIGGNNFNTGIMDFM